MSVSAAAPSDWDDQLSETFSDAFSDAFQVPLRQVRKNVLDRLSGGASSELLPPGGGYGYGGNDGGKMGGGDQQLRMEHFDGWTQAQDCNDNNYCVGKIEQSSEKKDSSSLPNSSVAVVEHANSLAMSYSSSSDTTNGREARDDFAEQGTVSSEDTSTAAPTSAASPNKEEVKVETVEVSTTVTTGGIEVLSPRQRLHQKYKLRVTEVHAKKKKKKKEEPENSVSASAHHDVKISRRNKATERLAKSRERFINRRHGGGEPGSAIRESTESPPPPPPLPPPPPHYHFQAIAANVAKEDGVALVINKIASIVKRHNSKHQTSSATDLTLLADELDTLKAQIGAEVEESNDMMMVLEANLNAAKIENNSLAQQLDELNEELTFSRAEKQCLADKMEDLIDKLTSVKAEKTTLQCTADGVNNANQKLAQVAAELKRRTKILDEQVAMLEGEKTNMETQLKEKEVVIIELEDGAQTFNDELQLKNMKIEELVHESSNLREQILSLQGSVSTLQEDVTTKQKAVEDAAAYSTSLKEEAT
eukprot:scaffold18327_cov68-Skeletonema_dohrnii-CCMP3373.AAC.1